MLYAVVEAFGHLLMRLRRSTLNPLGPTLILLGALAASVMATPAAGQSWPIKQFEVRALEPAGSTGAARDDLLARISRMAGVDPDSIETVDVPDRTIIEIQEHLRGSAELLESWGFPPPRLEPVVETVTGTAYRVYLVGSIPGSFALGRYHSPRCWSPRENVILLSARGILNLDGTVAPSGFATISHELVHAVQFATPVFADDACEAGRVGAWITEGTASALGWDIARTLKPMPGPDLSGFGAIWGQKGYSNRLPEPSRSGSPSIASYRTASFWRFLAELQALGEQPGPKENPFDYRHLSRFFRSKPAAMDCTEGRGSVAPSCDAELRWIDANLRSQFGRGLKDLFPRFMDVYALYGENRVSETGAGFLPTKANTPEALGMRWRGDGFEDGCYPIRLKLAPDSLQARSAVELFDEVSAQCWEVKPKDFEGPITIAVTVDRPSPAELSQLSAVTAGGSTRVDTAEVRFKRNPDRPYATWTFDVDPATDSVAFFILTNVEHDPAETVPLVNTPVTITALESLASMAAGSVTGGGGPSGADVDRPLPLELDSIRARAFPDPASMARGEMADPCVLTMDMFNEDRGDALQLALAQDGPIGPGEYFVARATPMDIHPQNSPGEFKLNFRVGEDNPLSGGQAQDFFGEAGTVEIESVKAGLVQGRLVATGWRRRYDGPSQYEKPYGMENIAIEVRFAVIARNAVWEVDSQCLAE
jgi:hypothetical protein